MCTVCSQGFRVHSVCNGAENVCILVEIFFLFEFEKTPKNSVFWAKKSTTYTIYSGYTVCRWYIL